MFKNSNTLLILIWSKLQLIQKQVLSSMQSFGFFFAKRKTFLGMRNFSIGFQNLLNKLLVHPQNYFVRKTAC